MSFNRSFLKPLDEVAGARAVRDLGAAGAGMRRLRPAGELFLVQFAGVVEVLVEGLGGGEELFPRHDAVLVSIGALHDRVRKNRARPWPLGRAVGHDHDHGDDLLVGEEIVENEIGCAVPGPAPFVVTGAVQQIQDRIWWFE